MEKKMRGFEMASKCTEAILSYYDICALKCSFLNFNSVSVM